MRNTWARAWLAATALLVAASAIARSRHDTLLKVEEPVMDWLLDGTDTSGWDRTAIFGSTWLIVVGTLILAFGAFFLHRRVAVAIIVTSVLATVLANFVSGVVERPTPLGETTPGSFPSVELVQTGVFWGMIVLGLWWIGAPKLVWQIGLELAIVMTLLVAIRLTVTGEIWPSDAVGSAIVVAVSLILAAIVFESCTPRLPWLERTTSTKTTATA